MIRKPVSEDESPLGHVLELCHKLAFIAPEPFGVEGYPPGKVCRNSLRLA